MSGPQRADAASGGSDDAEAFALAEEAAWLSLGLAESGQREAGQQELEEPGVGASAVTGVVREGSLAMYDAAEGLEEWAVGAAASAASSRGPKDPADLPLCSSYVAGGWCARGEDCLYIHGELCELCERFALHPYNAEQVETHIKSCTALQQRLEARALSAAKECSICLERVLAKPEVKQRRFGLLTSCSHSFCLGCIRGWRSATDSDADVDTALRTCPICRMQSWYVVPSPVWPSSEEEKKEIIEGYRRKLSLIDCKHWNRGRSTCPFGTSCFYRHAYEDGSLQDRTLVRRATDQHGDLHILGSVRLSQFFDDPEVQQMLRRRRGFRGSVRR